MPSCHFLQVVLIKCSAGDEAGWKLVGEIVGPVEDEPSWFNNKVFSSSPVIKSSV